MCLLRKDEARRPRVLLHLLWRRWVSCLWRRREIVKKGWGVMPEVKWMLEMRAEPVIPAWEVSARCETNGAELQRAMIRGFSSEGDPIWSSGKHKEFTFEKIFTFKEHGEFFRGALTMASLRYAGDFYDLLQRYGTIKVTIVKAKDGRSDG